MLRSPPPCTPHAARSPLRSGGSTAVASSPGGVLSLCLAPEQARPCRKQAREKAAYVNRAQPLTAWITQWPGQLANGMRCLLLSAANSRLTCQKHMSAVAATNSLAERRNRQTGLRSTSQKASRGAQTLALRGVRRLPADPSAVPALRVDILDASSVCKPWFHRLHLKPRCLRQWHATPS
jgi:hypothetical protein